MSDLIIPQKYFKRIGEVNGKMTIIDVVRTHAIKKRNGEAYSYIQAVTQCICGKISLNNFSNLTQSCVSCMLEIRNGRRYKHKLTRSPEYKSWSGAKSRCYNPKDKDYPNYGGRGIRFCDRWIDKENGFLNFLADMNERPEPKRNYSIDRRDNNGNYEPSNCYWATAYEQRHNRRPVKFKHLKICLVCGIEYPTLEPNNSMYCGKKCKMRGGYLKRSGQCLPFEYLKHVCNPAPQSKLDDPPCNK